MRNDLLGLETPLAGAVAVCLVMWLTMATALKKFASKRAFHSTIEASAMRAMGINSPWLITTPSILPKDCIASSVTFDAAYFDQQKLFSLELPWSSGPQPNLLIPRVLSSQWQDRRFVMGTEL